MTDLQFLLVNSFAPIGALVIAGIVLFINRDKPKRPRPGE